MIINGSRMKTADTCWRKAFNQFHRHLEGGRSMNLVDGSAVHAGIAHGMATKNWPMAYIEAMKKFDEGLAVSSLPPEQTFLIDEHRKVVAKVLEIYQANYPADEWEVVQPECKFDIALPESNHNCIMMHWFDLVEGVDVWGPPPADKILMGAVASRHSTAPTAKDKECACWVPHRYVGTTDALVLHQGMLWLLEHKTTAIQGAQYWAQWALDKQTTGYIYGIWKSLGIRPRGFLVNALYKPSEAQIASWQSRSRPGTPKKDVTDYMGYDRQGFLRTEEDLYRFERDTVEICNEWEMRVKGQLTFRMTPHSGACTAYNRLCDFHTACVSHEEPGTMDAYERRPDDYVDEKLSAKLLSIQPAPRP